MYCTPTVPKDITSFQEWIVSCPLLVWAVLQFTRSCEHIQCFIIGIVHSIVGWLSVGHTRLTTISHNKAISYNGLFFNSRLINDHTVIVRLCLDYMPGRQRRGQVQASGAIPAWWVGGAFYFSFHIILKDSVTRYFHPWVFISPEPPIHARISFQIREDLRKYLFIQRYAA
jgi:hypothetical protein